MDRLRNDKVQVAGDPAHVLAVALLGVPAAVYVCVVVMLRGAKQMSDRDSLLQSLGVDVFDGHEAMLC